MLSVTDADISYAESVFLRPGESFDEERKEVIKSLTSCDVLACPGSGKTTALLAKLAILATKMPLKDLRGVCVLTHTNVAIDEIRARLGVKGEILLKYPNFFGTIQSFVDRFLAIPAAVHYYGKRPVRIDAEFHDYEIIRRFTGIPNKKTTWGFLSQQGQYRGLKALEYLVRLRLNLIDRTLLSDILDSKSPLKKNTSDSYKLLFPLKEGMLKDGILHFDDAYSLAQKYVNDYQELLKPVFSRRFAFLFVDEMQDTDACQLEIIDNLFDSTKTAVQKIGDINQAIFTPWHVNSQTTAWKPSSNCLKICGSKRFSQKIAAIARTCCISRHEIQGNPSVPDLPVYMLLHDETTRNRVLPAFGDLIISHRLHEVDRACFRAAGWVGKFSGNNRTLPYYWPAYTNKRNRQRLDFDSLHGYVQKQGNVSKEPIDADCYRATLLRGLARLMRIAGVRDACGHWYTANSIEQFIKDQHSALHTNLLTILAKWILEIADGKSIIAEVRNFVTTSFIPALVIRESSETQAFISGPKGVIETVHAETQPTECDNTYTHVKDNTSISIVLDTIHGVKGQTHCATLYLETSYRKGHDVCRVIDFLTGSLRDPKPIEACSLRMAYVALTRPTHLLCVAAHKDSVVDYTDKLKERGWSIMEL
jgi:DNA helicase II / ATP-dependent DNA helicase PcrA